MRYVITHGHIFKNAGSTFDGALKKAFGKGFIDHRDDIAMRRGGADYLNDLILSNPKLQAISSHHLCNPLPISSDYECLPVYFVRNPIERIISVYNFERIQRSNTLGAVAAKKYNLVDYVKWRFEPSTPKVISNYQTAYIGCIDLLRPEDRVPESAYQRILDLHSKGKIFLGLVDRFGPSVEKLQSKVKLFSPNICLSYVNENVRNPSASNEKFLEACKLLSPVLPQIFSENSLDVALHQYLQSYYLE